MNLSVAFLLLTACNFLHSDPTMDSYPTREADGVGLSFRPDTIQELEIPEHNRSEGIPTPDAWTIQSPWTKMKTNGLVTEYATQKPFKMLQYGPAASNSPRSIRVTLEGYGKLKYRKQKARVGTEYTWGFRGNTFIVRVPAEHDPKGNVSVAFSDARNEELARHFDTAERTKEDFVFRTMGLKDVRSHGLYLPAPTKAVFEVSVPSSGVFATTAHLLAPVFEQQETTNGALVRVALKYEGSTHELAEVKPNLGQPTEVRLDLSKWSGKTVQLHIITDPLESTVFDYIFLQDPVLYTPKKTPDRILFALIDTLRADHLGAYGYPRDTSPNIDALASRSVVFEHARSPAPWTLPSSLAALYGRTPEHVDGHPHLAEILGKRGWASCGVVTNNWLIGPDTLGGGWSAHWARPQSPAARQARKIKRCMDKYPDRDVLMLVHMIDPHTPYAEAKKYKNRFTGKTPEPFKKRFIAQKIIRKTLNQATTKAERREVEEYLIGRYDQNILAVDDAMGQILDHIGPQATVVFTSDHGEELFEHGGFTHGHTLYEEVVHVPLIVRSPSLEPSRVASAVTLMDIVPTVLQLHSIPRLDTPTEGHIGMSLVSVAQGKWGAESALAARPIALGRTLKKNEQWGVVKENKKWISDGPDQLLFDLKKDAKEKHNIMDKHWTDQGTFHQWLSQALKQDIQPVIRISGKKASRGLTGGKSRIEVSHPNGIAKAWTPMDPRGEYADATVEDKMVFVPVTHGQKTANELFVMLPPDTSPVGLEVQRKTTKGTLKGEIKAEKQEKPGPLLQVGKEQNGFRVDVSWQPVPTSQNGIRFTGTITDDLRALGYME